jgi:type II secretory pathway predicted ATPase ExeA
MTGPFSSFFDLRDNPFRANPDPRYLFLTQQTKENLDQIIEGIRTRKGLLLQSPDGVAGGAAHPQSIYF